MVTKALLDLYQDKVNLVFYRMLLVGRYMGVPAVWSYGIHIDEHFVSKIYI